LAAQYYWKALFGKDFVRDQNADGVNSVLNYGYSIIRAMIARSIVASGLHPAIGLFHHNQYNGLCLADDLMEPFRPWVDSIAYQQLYQENTNIAITKETKIPFLNLISENVKFKNKQMPLMVSVHYLMADLKRNFAKESKKIVYPKK
jgi:CRISPR-associated protein Cas1